MWQPGRGGRLLIGGLLFVLASASSWASSSSTRMPPTIPPATQAYPLAETPVLDGDVLGDPAWGGARATTGFWQIKPFEGRPASQRTEVFVGYTEDALYIGAVLYDDEPSAIIVTDSRRDAELDNTDAFQVILDTYLDRQNGFVFGTNPAGIEYDGQVTREGTQSFGSGGGGFNLNWDTTWNVATELGDYGWSVEMRIPFRSLRYKGRDVQIWGINFQRNIRRNNEVAFWSPLQRQYNLFRVSDAGRLEGITLPPQRNLKVTPYALGKADWGTDYEGTEYDTELGGDLKWSMTPSLTLDATINTDFAQVEVDEVVVNLDRFNVFLPEKRPFFLENAGQFSVGSPEEVELFFSRRIGISSEGAIIPIDWGARLTGKAFNRTNVGLLQMRSSDVAGEAPQNDFTVIRVNQELAKRSSLGAIFVNRDGDGSMGPVPESDDYNRTYGIDGRWGIGDELMISGYLAKTDTPGLDGKDHALQIRGDYNSERWSNGIGYSEVGGEFNPEVGFVRRYDYRKADFRVLRRYRPQNLWGLQELRPHVSYRGFWNFDGVYESGFLHVDNHWEFRSGAEIHTGVNFVHEDVLEPFSVIPGEVVLPGTYDNAEMQLVMYTNRSAPLSVGMEMYAGGYFSGDRLTLEPDIQYRIGDRFKTSLAWNYNHIDLDNEIGGPFDINVGIFRLSYAFTPKMSLEGLIQYDDRTDALATNLRFAWLNSASSGLYLVYNESDMDDLLNRRQTSKEFIIKYSYIFDLL
ncbi:MAG: DUF5916 domain-containing protein [Pseudomonadales bacterium]